MLQETEEERSLRTRVFVQGAFHWSVSIIGYCIFFVVGCVSIPHVFSPVKVRTAAHMRCVLARQLCIMQLVVVGDALFSFYVLHVGSRASFSNTLLSPEMLASFEPMLW